MPSATAITRAGIVNRSAVEDVGELLDQFNAGVSEISRLSVKDQRRSLGAFVAGCGTWLRQNPGWLSRWHPISNPADEDWDVGKLDLLSIAEGKRPQLYGPGTLIKFRFSPPLGLSDYPERMIIPEDFGVPSIIPPLLDEGAIRRAGVLVERGYYDIPHENWGPG